MDSIPVKFQFQGHEVKAELRPFLGIGQREDQLDIYFLANSMKHFGRLHKINNEWVLFPYEGCEELESLADYFTGLV